MESKNFKMQFERHLSEIFPNFGQKIAEIFCHKLHFFKNLKPRKPKEKLQKSVKKGVKKQHFLKNQKNAKNCTFENQKIGKNCKNF